MAFDVKTLAAINLGIQLILTLALLSAVHLAKSKKFKKHCKVMRIAFPVQILAILAVMLPSMNGYLKHGSPGQFFFHAEILMHHSLGLLAVILWVYINLIFLKYLRTWFGIRTAMRLGLACWMTSLIMGFHIFMLVYV
jgi:uncharacterized membrane protein YozB (DUF420 family)